MVLPRERLLKHAQHAAVDLHRDDPPRAPRELQSERPRAGPHLQHIAARLHRRGCDFFNDVLIDEEVLPQAF